MISKAATLFDELIIAIGENPSKKYHFSTQERVQHIENALGEQNLKAHIKIDVIKNKFLVKYAESNQISYFVRGIRSNDDFHYEYAMNQINRELAETVEGIYLIPPDELSQISSSMVKGLVGIEGWEEAVAKYVPQPVLTSFKKNL